MPGVHCEWDDCRRVFATDAQLYAHVCTDHVGRRASRNLQLTCRWARCGRSFRKRDHVTSHCKVHLNHKPYKCPVPLCTRAFKRLQDLKKHVRVHDRAARDAARDAATAPDAGMARDAPTAPLPSPPGNNNYVLVASPRQPTSLRHVHGPFPRHVPLLAHMQHTPFPAAMPMPMPMPVSMSTSMSMSMPMPMAMPMPVPMSLPMPMAIPPPAPIPAVQPMRQFNPNSQQYTKYFNHPFSFSHR